MQIILPFFICKKWQKCTSPMLIIRIIRHWIYPLPLFFYTCFLRILFRTNIGLLATLFSYVRNVKEKLLHITNIYCNNNVPPPPLIFQQKFLSIVKSTLLLMVFWWWFQYYYSILYINEKVFYLTLHCLLSFMKMGDALFSSINGIYFSKSSIGISCPSYLSLYGLIK